MLKTLFEIIATMADDPDKYRSDVRKKLLELADTMPLAPMPATREKKVRGFVKETVGNLLINQQGKYPPAEPGALGIGPLEAAGLNPKLCLTWSAHDIRSPDVTSILYPIFRHSGEQMPLENCVAT